MVNLLLASSVLVLAVWLELRDRWELKRESKSDFFDEGYLRKRRRGRKWLHSLLAVCGVVILITGLIEPGLLWMILWLAVCVLLTAVVTLGMMDAVRTNRYWSKRLPSLQRETLDQPLPAPSGSRD